MKRIHPVFIYCAIIAWTSISWSPAPGPGHDKTIPGSRIPATDSLQFSTTSLYERLDLAGQGLSRQAFDYAMRGYRKLVSTGRISNTQVITICDFSQSSRRKRMYILDLASAELLLTSYVAHGKNSGAEYATKFSNKPSSLQSSLGFYKTSGTYYGGHGLSLRVQGLEYGINDKAMARNIVVHGAEYLGDQRLSAAYMGRSYGCPAVPKEECNRIIDIIKNGTCLFIYHPSTGYAKRSKILND